MMLRWHVALIGLPAVMLSGCMATVNYGPNPVHAEKVVAVAKKMIGKPYRYGGASPSGFDCSGLVSYVYKNALGVKLPRTSTGLYAYSRPVPLGHEKPSDLLFYKINGNKVSHVGIYIGKGQFIHAATTGKIVRQSDANKKYWRKRFAGVRRLIR